MNWKDDKGTPTTPEEFGRGERLIVVVIATIIAIPILTLIFQAVAR